MLPPPRESGALRGWKNVSGVTWMGAAGSIDRDIGSDVASSNSASRTCSPNEYACDLAMGMRRVSRSKSMLACARGCLLRSTRVRAVHSPPGANRFLGRGSVSNAYYRAATTGSGVFEFFSSTGSELPNTLLDSSQKGGMLAGKRLPAPHRCDSNPQGHEDRGRCYK